MNSVLVGIDGSAPSLVAARLGAEIASASGAPLVLAYVVPALGAGVELGPYLPPQVYEQLNRNGSEELQRVSRMIGRTDAECLLLQGNAAEALSQAAEERNASMVVVGSRGRGTVARVLLGSVADRLAHISRRPVLVAR